LSDKYDEAVKLNNDIERQEEGLRNNVSGIKEDVDKICRLKEEIEELQREIKDLESENIVVEKANKQIREWLSKNKPIETEEIKQEMLNANKINEQIGARERNKVKDSKHKYEQSVYEKLTAKITDRRNSKDKALQEAKLPLPGLTVNTLGTFFNGIPINQLSTSENIKVAMSIAMALNYKLKVILVKNASLLDEDNVKVIKEMVKGKGYQVWLEKVDSTGDMGFYFVDGEIESINGEKVISEEAEDGELVDKQG